MKLYNLFLTGVTVFAYSCGQNSKIEGYWKATFNDPIENPVQFLEIKKLQNKLTINIDEPYEDWFNIPGEKINFQKDSLHYERFWGLEKYDGIVLPGDSIIKGVANSKQATCFVHH